MTNWIDVAVTLFFGILKALVAIAASLISILLGAAFTVACAAAVIVLAYLAIMALAGGA